VTVTATEEREERQPVLLFDGECGLCQACVRFLLRVDQSGRLRFAPLQGAAAQEFLRAQGLPTADFDTLIFVPDWRRRAVPGTFLVRTDGVLAAAAETGGWTAAFAELRVIPRAVRDGFYRVVAWLRYRVLGRSVPRPLARPEWAARFL
jgi:predicted DCC family thiol-disulfide oxidoreductase YuxK